MTYQGWQSPWAPIVETEKSGTSYIDALLPDMPVKYQTDTFYGEEGEGSPIVLTYSFPGTSSNEVKFADNYDDWKTSDVNIFPFRQIQMEAARML